MLSRLGEIIWPIRKAELSKFLPMSMMLLLTLFNYNALRSLKDALVVPNIGAESISFIKFFCVVPMTLIFVIIYTKLTNIWNFRKIYLAIASFFAIFFILFGWVLYPNEALLHHEMVVTDSDFMDLGFCQIGMDHFKWFFLIYGKWLYALFFMVAELWSVMNVLLFWQFANHVIKTDEAKRFYPMFAFMGSFGTFIAGSLIQYLSDLRINLGQDTVFLVTTISSLLAVVTLGIMSFFEYINRNVIKDQAYLDHIRTKKPEQTLSLKDSFNIIVQSRYLRYIAILVLGYGFTINILEGPWKAAARMVYPCTDDYIVFSSGVQQMIGGCSMIFILLGVYILRKYSWLVAAMITPLTFCITGLLFFITIVFDQYLAPYMGAIFPFEAMTIAVYLGTTQTVLSKSTKYALFDPTKEMTYIPLNYQLRSKGKAAVDLLANKLSKSGSSLLQTLLFIIFPSATYLNIAGILMWVFLIVSIIWMVSVRSLSKEYQAALVQHSHDTNF